MSYPRGTINMPRLSSSMCSLLNEEVIKELDKLGIKTVTDFVSIKPFLMSKNTSLSIQEIQTIHGVLMGLFVSFPVTAEDLWNDRNTSSIFLSTGCERIDSLLDGGILTGELLDISGLTATGKTQLCLTLTAHTVCSKMSTVVVYVDTQGSFSATRVKDIVSLNIVAQCSVENVLSRVIVYSITDLFQLVSFVWELREKIASMSEMFYSNINVFIIDSLSSLILPLVGNDQAEVTNVVDELVFSMRLLAQEYSIAIIYTSSPAPFHNGRLKPILSSMWESVPNVRLNLGSMENVSNDEQTGVITLTKSSRIENGKFSHYRITQSGIV